MRAVRLGALARDPRTDIQVRIGVMGSAGGDVDPGVADACRALGRAIAERGCCLLTGACQGLPHDAVLGAKETHGHVVGISPASTLKEHVETYSSPYREYDILSAPFIIRGELDSLPEVAAAREHVLILQDFDLRSDGRPADPGMSAMMLGREGSLITVSGKRRPQYGIEQDGMVRLRLLNASVSRFYRLKVDEHPLHIIATDGGALATTQTVDDLVMAPGERRDVLIHGMRESGTYRLMNLPYDRGSMGMMGGSGMMGGRDDMMRGMSGVRRDAEDSVTELATFVYRGRAARRMTVPETLVAVPALPVAAMQRTFELGDAMGMRLGGMGMRFVINGREFDHARIDTRVRLDSVEEWEYVNTTTMDHPMHIHTNSAQLVGRAGESERAWRDIVVVKARSRARLRVKFEDFAGKTVQHCHILDHEDRGMMATILMER